MQTTAETLIPACDKFVTDHGLVNTLFALANAIRGENDRVPRAATLDENSKQLQCAREYVASQLAGLAAFWRLAVREQAHR